MCACVCACVCVCVRVRVCVCVCVYTIQSDKTSHMQSDAYNQVKQNMYTFFNLWYTATLKGQFAGIVYAGAV